MDGFAGPGPIFRRESPRGGSELGSGDLAANGAGRDSDHGIISHALVFSRVAAGHYVELAVFLAEPDRGGDGRSVLTKTYQRNVLLATNLGRERHDAIVSTDDAVLALAFLAGGSCLALLVLLEPHPLPASMRLC